MWQKMQILGSDDPLLKNMDGRELWVNIERAPFYNDGSMPDERESCIVRQGLETNIESKKGQIIISVRVLEHAPGDDSFAEEVPDVPYEKWVTGEIEAA